MNRDCEIPDDFLAQLKLDLVSRCVGRGMARLDGHRRLLSAFNPKVENAGVLAGYLAQWVDIGYQRATLVKEVVGRFSRSARCQIPLRDYIHLRMAEGMIAMTEESKDEAISHLDFALSLAGETDDRELQSIANFWKSRCLRMKGEYDQALAYAVQGRTIASELRHPAMAAVMRVLESWLLFQKGELEQALDILKESEGILSKTDDYLTLGNIHSSYGRIAERQGRYEQAIEHFTAAIEQYKKRDIRHRNVARSLNNRAHVKRLIATRFRQKIDLDAARFRMAALRGSQPRSKVKSAYRERFESLRKETLADLDEAATIYSQYSNRHGLGSVHLNYGYLHLDSGNLEEAGKQAQAAFELGEGGRDHILMARARVLQCMVENGHVEEDIGESSEPGVHARLAQDYAREAIELAKHTQNRRLLATAYVWHGLTYCNRFFDDPETAARCYDQAVKLSKGDRSDTGWSDLETLHAKTLRSGNMNPLLRAWSQGSVGDKTFQEITEEFAAIIIPKIWEREGRKISRVATRLSISPKKVRRILKRAVKTDRGK